MKKTANPYISFAAASFIIAVLFPLNAKGFFLEDIFEEFNDEFWQEFGGTKENQVINKAEVSAETGETIVNGEIKEGKAVNKVSIKNIINGEEMEPVDIESKEDIFVSQEIEVEEGDINVEKEIIIGEESGEDKESLVEKNPSYAEATEEQDLEQKWWAIFFQGLASVFNNLLNFFK